MSILLQLEGVTPLTRKMEQKAIKNINVKGVVGYAMPYAVYVHEDLQAHHKPGKQAKFLEGPARLFARQIGKAVSDEYKKSKDMAKAVMAGLNYLKARSVEVVPVAKGALLVSVYACLEKDQPIESANALDRGLQIIAMHKK